MAHQGKHSSFFSTKENKSPNRLISADEDENLRLLQLNVQNLSNKLDILELLFSEACPDIVSVVEHWCTSDSVKTMTIAGYTLTDYYCRPQREHGGSLIYVRNDVLVRNLSVSVFSDEMNFEVSGTIVMANDIRVGIISVYRPGSGDFEVFLDRLSYTLNHCSKLVDVIFVCGDLNVNYLKVDCTNRKLFIDLLDCFHLRLTSQEPTRVFTDKTGRTFVSKVDYVLTNADQSDLDVKVFEPYVSDHRAIILQFRARLEVNTQSRLNYVRNLCQENLDTFVFQISNCKFQAVYKSDDVDNCFQAFVSTICNIF